MPSKSNTNIYPFFALFLICASGAAAYVTYNFARTEYEEWMPSVSILKNHYPVVVGKEGKTLLIKLQDIPPKNWVRARDVSKDAVRAILLSEDSFFYQHGGYDPAAIRAAMEYNLKSNAKIKRGASTITQQVVKNIFLTPEKTMTRKLRELLLSMSLEREFTKTQILEFYLNIAEWGPGIYGIKAASAHYFNKLPSELTAREGATLAFLLPNPIHYQKSFQAEGGLSDFGRERVESILEKMNAE